MNFSYGFVETRGYIAAVEAADAMVKAAKVEIVKWRKAGGALVMVVVKGELGACRAAVDAGAVAAERVGELVSSNVIANPYGDTGTLVEEYLGGSKPKKPVPPSKAQVIVSKEEPIPVKKAKPVVKPKTVVAPKPAPKKPAPKPAKPESPKPKAKSAEPEAPKPKEKPAVKKAASFSPPERLLNLIAAAPQGITLNQLAEEIQKPAAEIRQLIKKLMDRNVVEKVQKRYFIIDSRSKK